MRLCFKNAKRYNLEGSDIHKMASDLEVHFERTWADMLKNQAAGISVVVGGGTKRPLDDAMPDSSSAAEPMAMDVDPASHVQTSAGPVAGAQVSDEDRRTLGNKINRLTGEQLGQLIDLVRDECPKCYEQFSEEECEIDIDSLGRADFDRLMTFVESR
jgi:hypothetical protein